MGNSPMKIRKLKKKKIIRGNKTAMREHQIDSEEGLQISQMRRYIRLWYLK